MEQFHQNKPPQTGKHTGQYANKQQQAAAQASSNGLQVHPFTVRATAITPGELQRPEPEALGKQNTQAGSNASLGADWLDRGSVRRPNVSSAWSPTKYVA